MALTKVIGAGAEGLTLSSTDLKIDSGDLIFGTSAKGVVIGATSNTDANTLDDFEQGTWTPTYTGAASAPTISYTIQAGSYIKVGNLVHIQGRIKTASTSGGSGNLLLEGLPFTTLSTSNHFSTIHIGYNVNWAADNYPMSMYTNNGSASLLINHFRADDPRDGIGVLINTSDLTNSNNYNDIIFSGTYMTQ